MNYNLVMEEIIDGLNYKPKLLMHACCGVCSSSVIERLNDYFDITILYYNPNTYPFDEYIKRLDTLKELIDKIGLKINLMEIGWENEKFESLVKGLENEREGGARCDVCYKLRLEKTALIAKEKCFDYFCTTLSVSPYKNSSLLNKIGSELEDEYGVKYLYSDFKKKDGYKRSNELSRKFDLYRQDYCGCKYSLMESRSH